MSSISAVDSKIVSARRKKNVGCFCVQGKSSKTLLVKDEQQIQNANMRQTKPIITNCYEENRQRCLLRHNERE